MAADALALYRMLVATIPSVELKGATMPYTSVNGNMFSFLTSAGALALRLSADERQTFIKRFKTRLCEQHGKVLQEYVEVPPSLLGKTKELKKYFEASFAYTSALKPKPTKKPSTGKTTSKPPKKARK